MADSALQINKIQILLQTILYKGSNKNPSELESNVSNIGEANMYPQKNVKNESVQTWRRQTILIMKMVHQRIHIDKFRE